MPFKIACFLSFFLSFFSRLFLDESLSTSVINGPMTSQTGSGNDKFQEPIKTAWLPGGALLLYF